MLVFVSNVAWVHTSQCGMDQVWKTASHVGLGFTPTSLLPLTELNAPLVHLERTNLRLEWWKELVCVNFVEWERINLLGMQPVKPNVSHVVLVHTQMKALAPIDHIVYHVAEDIIKKGLG